MSANENNHRVAVSRPPMKEMFSPFVRYRYDIVAFQVVVRTICCLASMVTAIVSIVLCGLAACFQLSWE